MVVTITTIFRSIPQVQSAFFQSDLPSHAILTGVGEAILPLLVPQLATTDRKPGRKRLARPSHD